MKTRHKRLLLIAIGLVILGLIVTLVLNAFRSNLVFFFSPSQVAAGEAPRDKSFRIGGLVKEASLKREADGVTIAFIITDTAHDVPVRYKGILPDLFKEGKGAVAQGKFGADNVFTAAEVLAKHDENYMPPEAAKAVGDAQAQKAAIEATSRTIKQ